MTDYAFNLIVGSAHITRVEPCESFSAAQAEAELYQREHDCDIVQFYVEGDDTLDIHQIIKRTNGLT